MFRFSAIPLVFLGIIFLPAASSTCPRTPLKLSEKDTMSTVQMHTGDMLEIPLRGNPSTGYLWEVSCVNTAILKEIGETTFTPDRKARGSGGTITMHFEALTAGKTTLKLIYHRPFEKNMPPIGTFEVTVIVK